MKCRCPFSFWPRVGNCIYISDTGICDDFEANPGNGDAWCNQMIQLALTTYEYVEQMQEDSNHTL